MRAERPNHMYRSAHDKMILGVCGGVAEYFNWSANVLRLLVIVLAIATAVMPIVIGYLVLGVLLKPAPERPFADAADQEFWTIYQDSPSLAMGKLDRQYDELDRRLQRLESIVTSPRFDLDEQYRNL